MALSKVYFVSVHHRDFHDKLDSLVRLRSCRFPTLSILVNRSRHASVQPPRAL